MNRNGASNSTFEMLSDEGDLYSDDDESGGSYLHGDLQSSGLGDKNIPSAADRRAHHNALERKRRDHIKDSFSSLRDSVPSLQGEKASRAQILKKAAEYIQFMRRKNTNIQSDIDEIAKQNKMLEEQIRLAEKQRGGGAISLSSQSLSLLNSEPTDMSSSYDISENSNESASNDLSVGAINGMVVANHHHLHNGHGDSPRSANGGDQLVLTNGTGGTGRAATVRSVVKNGTSTIIVQNPQLKSSNQHVIHVTSSSVLNGNTSNSSNISATATPIIISTSSLASSPGSSSSSSSVGSNNGATGGGGNAYVINKSTGSISLPNGFRTVVVQQSSSSGSQGSTGAGTTTPNIHIVSTLPSTYSGRTKRLKISPSDSVDALNGATSVSASTGNNTNQTSFSVTSVSS